MTLLFSREQYIAAAEAYLRGIERRIAAGLDPQVASVASLFVSRWDVAVTDKVAGAVAQPRSASPSRSAPTRRIATCSPRRAGRSSPPPARGRSACCWASTGTKDPQAPDTLYIEALAAPDTIDTMPEKTLHAFAEHGAVSGVMPVDGGTAEAVLAEFTKAGHRRRRARRDLAARRRRGVREVLERAASTRHRRQARRVCARPADRRRTAVTCRSSPLAGKPAPRLDLVDVPQAGHGLLHRAARSRRRRRSASPSAPPAIAARRSTARFNECARARHHPGDLRVPRSARASTGRSSSASTRTRCRSRRCASALEVLAANGVEVMIAEGRRIHADAGDLARDPHLQPRPHERAGRRHRRHAVAQSARRRRLQVQPAATAARPTPTSPAGSSDRPTSCSTHELDGVRRMPLDARAPRRDARASTTSSAPTSATSAAWSTSTRSAARASASASIRSAAPASHYWARIAERYGLDLTVVSDAVDPTFRFMTARLGRQDPHGSVVAVRDAAPDRPEGPLRHRLRLRHRPRPPRHRHPQRAACCRRITISRSAIDYLFAAPAAMAAATPASARPSSAAA